MKVKPDKLSKAAGELIVPPRSGKCINPISWKHLNIDPELFKGLNKGANHQKKK